MESVLRNHEQEDAMEALLQLEEWDGETYRMIWDELRRLAQDDGEAWFAFGRMLQTFISSRDALRDGRAEIRDGFFVMLEGGTNA